MNTTRTILDCPKTVELIKVFMKNNSLKALDSLELKDNAFLDFLKEQAIEDSDVIKFLDENPFSFLEFFDEHNIFIMISRKASVFSYSIKNLTNTSLERNEDTFKSRVLAVETAVKKSFSVLEKKLDNLEGI